MQNLHAGPAGNSSNPKVIRETGKKQNGVTMRILSPRAGRSGQWGMASPARLGSWLRLRLGGEAEGERLRAKPSMLRAPESTPPYSVSSIRSSVLSPPSREHRVLVRQPAIAGVTRLRQADAFSRLGRASFSIFSATCLGPREERDAEQPAERASHTGVLHTEHSVHRVGSAVHSQESRQFPALPGAGGA